MNNNIKIFNNDVFGEVRVVMVKSEPWWVASDVCNILDYRDAYTGTRRLDEDEKDTHLVCTPGGNQNMTIVNEYGLYNLILGSKKKEAKEFKRWITHEVIPSIRKTGSYSVEQYSNDITEFDMMRKMIDKLEEADRKADEALDKSNKLEHRVDNLDNVNLEGDLKDRLNSMIRKYARDNGVPYGIAWGKFYQSYNTSYRTNLKLRITNHKKKHGVKLSAPQLLELDNELEDAIRVADKMLN